MSIVEQPDRRATLAADNKPGLSLFGDVTPVSLTLPDDLPYEDWLEIGRQIEGVERSLMWLMGDWWRYGQQKYGERAAHALQSRFSFDTWAAAGWVAGKIESCRRRQVLSWSHHKEVAAFDAAEQARWLDLAVKNEWTRNDLRRAIRGEKSRGSLADRFIVPPMSILDTRQEVWQMRKGKWVATGLVDTSGRDAKSYNTDNTAGQLTEISGTSAFDPVLAEIVYTWFCPPGGTILDPFAGGPTRGVVAHSLGHSYQGMDISRAQIESNKLIQGRMGLEADYELWVHGDGTDPANYTDMAVDLVFTCPPYHDLERYSDDPSDLSTMRENKFNEKYVAALTNAAEVLRDNRFFCVVVGNTRAADGRLRDLCGTTVAGLEQAGLRYYNDIVIINSYGTVPARVSKQFEHSRKIGKVHQYLLVFVKGDATCPQ